MDEDWIEELVRQRQARGQRAREAATRRVEEDQRDRAAFARYFDRTWARLGAEFERAVGRYNTVVGVPHGVVFQTAPRGAMLIEKAAHPAGFLFLTPDRENRVFRIEFGFHRPEAEDWETLTDEGRFVATGETLAFCWKGQPFGPEDLARALLSALFERI